MGLKKNIVVLILTCLLSTIDAGAQTVSGQYHGSDQGQHWCCAAGRNGKR